MSLKILILTHHDGHTENNSVYAFGRAIYRHNQVEKVYVASRADIRNKSFFYECLTDQIMATQIDESFDYPLNQEFFKKAEINHIEYFDGIFLYFGAKKG